MGTANHKSLNFKPGLVEFFAPPCSLISKSMSMSSEECPVRSTIGKLMCIYVFREHVENEDPQSEVVFFL